MPQESSLGTSSPCSNPGLSPGFESLSSECCALPSCLQENPENSKCSGFWLFPGSLIDPNMGALRAPWLYSQDSPSRAINSLATMQSQGKRAPGGFQGVYSPGENLQLMTLAGDRDGVIRLVYSGWIFIQELIRAQGRRAECRERAGLYGGTFLSRRENAATVTKWPGLTSRDSWERIWPV